MIFRSSGKFPSFHDHLIAFRPVSVSFKYNSPRSVTFSPFSSKTFSFIFSLSGSLLTTSSLIKIQGSYSLLKSIKFAFFLTPFLAYFPPSQHQLFLQLTRLPPLYPCMTSFMHYAHPISSQTFSLHFLPN